MTKGFFKSFFDSPFYVCMGKGWLLSFCSRLSLFILALVVCLCSGRIVQAEPVGQGLFVKKCSLKTFYRDSTYFDISVGQIVTVKVPYDSTVCELVDLSSVENLTRCDTIIHSVEIIIDSIYQGSRSEIRGSDLQTIDKYLYDTIEIRRYNVVCVKVDSTFLYDTTESVYEVMSFDTIVVTDSFFMSKPLYSTAKSMQFCPHVYSSYSPYDGLAARFLDSVRYYEKKLDSLLVFWPDSLRIEKTLEELLNDVLEEKSQLYPDSIFDTAVIYDSLHSLVPETPSHYREKIKMFTEARNRYSDSIKLYEEYHIDSVNVVADLHMKGGAVMTDTFTIRTIPLFYELMPDTSVQFGRSLPIWAGSPHLPWNGADTYVELTWFPPVDAVTRKVVKPHQGFDADGLVEYGDVSLTDSVHIKALIRQGGINNFLAWAPIYTADTADGDSLLFPIRIKATKALMDHYPNAPKESCEYVDTVKVRIVKGYRVSGYVSYAGLWKPSEIGDTKSPDAPQYDGDLVAGGKIKHLPVANVKVYLIDLNTSLPIDSALSQSDGYYYMANSYMPGKYILTGKSPQKVSIMGQIGLNGNDATWVQNFVSNKFTDDILPGLTNPDLSMWWWAGNVNLSETPVLSQGFDGNDATAIQNKIVGKLPYNNKFSTGGSDVQVLDDWAYSVDTINLFSDSMFHVRGVMRGDANRDYDDVSSEGQLQRLGFRSNRKKIARIGQMKVDQTSTIIDLPILSMDSGSLSGFQMFIYYNRKNVEPLKVSLPHSVSSGHSNLEYNITNDQIKTTWISSDYPLVKVGDTLLILKFKYSAKVKKNISSEFNNNILHFVVSDTNSNIIPWNVYVPDLLIEKNNFGDTLGWKVSIQDGDTIYELPQNEKPLQVSGGMEEDRSHILTVVPNPISTWGDVTYYVSDYSLVNLKLYSLLGENVLTFVEGERQQGLYRLNMDMQTLPSGIYVLRLETSREGQTEFDIVKIIVKR